MKYPIYTSFTMLLLLLYLCCCHDNSNVAPVDQLPAATQEGKNTFGCLVDGQVFLPTSNPLAGSALTCAYQYIDYPGTKGYFFQLHAPNSGAEDTKSVRIFTDSLAVKEGDIIPLGRSRSGGANGIYRVLDLNSTVFDVSFNTTDTLVGELHLTKFDTVKLIASGTFWFNAIDTVSGKTIKVTDGRFDMLFTR